MGKGVVCSRGKFTKLKSVGGRTPHLHQDFHIQHDGPGQIKTHVSTHTGKALSFNPAS